MSKLLLEHHHAISGMLEGYRKDLVPVLEWAQRYHREGSTSENSRLCMPNSGHDDSRICAPDKGKIIIVVEFKDSVARLKLTDTFIIFHSHRIDILQPMAESIIASLTGMELGQVIDVPTKAIITKVTTAGGMINLFTDAPVAFLDVAEYISSPGEPS